MKSSFNRKLIVAAGLVFVTVCTAGLVLSQETTSYSPPHYSMSARSTALGDAAVGSSYDVSAMFWNPAAILFVQNFSVVADHHQEVDGNIMNEAIALPLYLTRTNALTVSTHIIHQGRLGSNSTSNQLEFIQYDMSLAFSQAIIPTLSIGGNVIARYGSTDASSQTVLGGGIGIFYSPRREIQYGMSFTGMGSDLRYSYLRPRTLIDETADTRRILIGASMQFPTDTERPIIGIMIANERDFDLDELRYKGGLELWPVEFLAGRFGYLVGPTLSNVRFGLGLQLDRIALDYAVSPKRAERFHQISFSVNFWRR